MKKMICLIATILFATSAESATIYDTIGLPKTFYVWSINFPISQKFSVDQNSKISNITVGVPSKSTPGRQLSVLLFDSNNNLLKTYSTPSEYYYNVDHYYTFNADDYNLMSGNYSFGVKMSNGPTGWIQTTGGMFGRIECVSVPEISTYIMGIISIIILSVIKFL